MCRALLIRCAATERVNATALSCPKCAAQMPETAAFCPGCGRAMRSVERARGRVGALPETVAGALAYCFLPAIVFLLVEPYSHNRFVRFHCLQSLGFLVAGLAAASALRIVSFVLIFIPVLGYLAILLACMVAGLAFLIVWAVLVVKALQGEMFELPVIGPFAAQKAVRG